MHFDATVTLGTVIQIIALACTAYAVVLAVKNRIEILESTLKQHAEALKSHDTVLGTYEARLFEIVGGLQRLIGRFETLERFESGKHGR